MRSTVRKRALVGAAVVAGLVAGSTTAVAEPAGVSTRGAVTRALDQVVRTGVPGAQAVVSDRGRSWEVSRGAGDLRTGRPFPPRARVRIGSNTKTFVAVVVLGLVGEGRVELDAPVQRYLPGVVRGNGNDGTRITVRQLLQHTSGLADYLAAIDPLSNRWKHVEPAEVVRIAMGLAPHFAPGSRWEYSNTNYVLAGMLVERVTGRSVAAEVERRITGPLGLRSTYFPRDHETGIRGPHPRGYAEIDGKRVDYTRQDPSWGGAAGAMVSTGEELNTFFAALLGGRLLPAAQLAEMKRTVPADVAPGASYGLGLIRYGTTCGRDLWGHGGSIPGYRTRGGITTTGRAVTVTVNQLVDTHESTTALDQAVDTAACS
ncbi:serine hydrolase domain-containing protein [Actinokineospora terrae]|uniref:D-alanyl-D-alanine carboxypeptidase n=1 Tax=Actinokineospora terrae TaxID=155974 RepID=A0A1H9N195_9PSEU|nr:serine hydrolase domain-containing protein [Actinokineospora terrae]SER29123.1 D-alanyl-D-alanine carboxypeptidase [Actinokineospora terrae]